MFLGAAFGCSLILKENKEYNKHYEKSNEQGNQQLGKEDAVKGQTKCYNI